MSLRIAGIIRLHKFEEELELVLNSLAKHCTALFLLTCNVRSKKMLRTITHTPKIRWMEEAPKPWTQITSLEAGMRMVDDMKPDIVLFPDEDELFPDNLADEIADWREVWDVRPTMSFASFQCIDNPQQILMEHIYRQAPHCKVLRWSPGISYTAGYAGWCWPLSHYQQKKYFCPYPLRHMAYMTQAQRDWRLTTRNGPSTGDREWYTKKRFRLATYVPNMTWKLWCDRVGPYTVELSLDFPEKPQTVLQLFRMLKLGGTNSEKLRKAIWNGKAEVYHDGHRQHLMSLNSVDESLDIEEPGEWLCRYGRHEARLRILE